MTTQHPSYPPLGSLEAVRAVGRHGSVTAAARTLGLTPGALSRHVMIVENWLGGPLFDRHGRGMRANAAGQRYLARLEEAITLLEAAGEPWRQRRGANVVRVSVLPSFASLWLLNRLRELELGSNGANPLRIEVHADARSVDLAAGEADVAIRYGRGVWPGVHARSLGPEFLVPVAEPEIAAGLGRNPRPEDLLSLPLLFDSDGVGWRSWLEAAGMKGFRPRAHDRRFESYELVLAAAEAGLGVALARLPLARSIFENRRLVALSTLEVRSPLGHFVLTRRGERRPAVETFVSRLLSTAPSPG